MRAALVLAGLSLLALIALPEADAKKPWEKQKLPLPAAPKKPWHAPNPWVKPKPWKGRDGHDGPGGHKNPKELFPKFPKHPKAPKPPRTRGPLIPKVPEVPKPLPRITPPAVAVPTPAQVEPAKVVVTPVATTTPPATQNAPARAPHSGGSVGRRAPAKTTPRRSTRRAASTSRPRVAGRNASGRRAARRRAASKPATRKPAGRGLASATPDRSSSVTRTVRDIVEVVPRSVEIALAALVCLSGVLGGGYLLSLARARRLRDQRGELLQEVGLLQAALLPSVPDTLGAVRPSVAYRPAEGLAAGGDFYDALELADGRSAFILGDVSGHGREALERTAFARYTLRAFLEAGLEPRVALQVAARVLGEHLGGEFITVLLAIHDPADGSLTWASAGHPAPIVMGPEPFEPVTAGSSPPIGMGLETGLRQSTIALPAGAVACMYTDGLVEARSDGAFMGRRGLEEILEELGPDATATALIELVAARSTGAADDMAACLLTPAGDGPATAVRREEIVVSSADIDRGVAGRFLDACGVEDVPGVLGRAAAMAANHDRTVMAVRFAERPAVELSTREDFDEEHAEAASRKLSAA